ncbi:MAG: roadblock/LC7 domain-containing protein [Gemmatimonadaceae bacterium]|nr:roadblock/LC7 domain-containing protein [Gemmatimonadaceae bacterium]
MHPGATSWSLSEADNAAIGQQLQRFLLDCNARCALVVDRSGQLITTGGDRPAFDVTAFATLAAADFSANDQLARLIGERDFNTLFHQGERESMLLADVARRAILVVLFDNRTTLGMVRLKMRGVVEELNRLFERMFAGSATRHAGHAPALLGDVDDEIDRLFQ